MGSSKVFSLLRLLFLVSLFISSSKVSARVLAEEQATEVAHHGGHHDPPPPSGGEGVGCYCCDSFCVGCCSTKDAKTKAKPHN